VIAREKQRKLVGSGAITDGETDAKNASVDGPLPSRRGQQSPLFEEVKTIRAQDSFTFFFFNFVVFPNTTVIFLSFRNTISANEAGHSPDRGVGTKSSQL
jgi:hypothetical protein